MCAVLYKDNGFYKCYSVRDERRIVAEHRTSHCVFSTDTRSLFIITLIQFLWTKTTHRAPTCQLRAQPLCQQQKRSQRPKKQVRAWTQSLKRVRQQVPSNNLPTKTPGSPGVFAYILDPPRNAIYPRTTKKMRRSATIAAAKIPTVWRKSLTASSRLPSIMSMSGW